MTTTITSRAAALAVAAAIAFTAAPGFAGDTANQQIAQSQQSFVAAADKALEQWFAQRQQALVQTVSAQVLTMATAVVTTGAMQLVVASR